MARHARHVTESGHQMLLLVLVANSLNLNCSIFRNFSMIVYII